MKRSNIWSILSSGILVMVVFFASVDFRGYQVHGTYMDVIQLTDNDYDDTSPQIHDGQVTWRGSDGSDLEIYLAEREITVIHYDPENPTIQSDANNTVDVLVITPDDPILLPPGESYVLPEAAPQTFTLNLTAGWNMVSIPFLPDDPSAQSVMDGIGFFQLVTWSGTGYIVSTEFELGKGYWLLVLEDTSITITE